MQTNPLSYGGFPGLIVVCLTHERQSIRLGRGGGLLVIYLAFYFNSASLNPVFIRQYCLKRTKVNEKEFGDVDHFYNGLEGLRICLPLGKK